MSLSKGFLHTQLPWCFVTKYGEGVVIQKDGALQRTFAFRAPDLDSSGPFEINGVALRINDAVKRLGSGWAIFIEATRFHTAEYPKTEAYRAGGFTMLAPYLIDREREASFSAAGKHFESSYYLTFAWKPPSENIKKLTNMFVAAASGDSGTVKENVALFTDETNAAASLLANNMLIAPLGNEETVAYLHSAVSLNRHPVRFPHTQILLDRVLPDMALQNSNTMMLGDYYIPVIGVNDFPDATYPAILDALGRARIEYRWVTRYLCLDKEEGKKETAKKEKSHRGSKKTFLQTFAESTSNDGSAGGGVINHGASVKEADSIAAAVEIETDEASLGYYTSSVMVWDKDLKAAKKKADMVRAIVNSAGFTCKEETFNALEAWKAMLPGECRANYRALPVMSYSFSHVLPLSSVWAGQRENGHARRVSGSGIPHVTCSTAEGTPFFLNINVNDVGHTAVWGPTGAGKSTFLNLLEAQFLKYPGSQIVVFDKGKSCRALCMACGGLFYEPAADSAAGIAFQPLRDLDTGPDMINAQDFIETCIEVNNYKVEPPMRAAIRECLDLLREKEPKTRTITSFVHYVNYLDPESGRPVFKEMLGDYLWAGKYGKIFDSSVSDISLDNRFTVIEMETLMGLREGCIVPALVYLFNLVDKKFDSRLSMLVLDEAWLFLKNQTFADKIAEWLKVLRKRNVFVVFATQDVADVENSPLKTTIIQQCLTKIYLADPSALTAGMNRVYGAFGLTGPEINLIAAAQMKRDYFYTSPLGRRLFRLDLGPLQLALLGAPDHELLNRLAAKYGGGVPLCREILREKGAGFSHLLGHDAPDEAPPAEAGKPVTAPARSAPPPPPEEEAGQAPAAVKAVTPDAVVLDEAAKISARSKRGQGRAAINLAEKLGVGVSKVTRARRVLKFADEATLALVREGKLSISGAARMLTARPRESA